GLPNTCQTAGTHTINVGPGGLQNINGTVDPSGDDYFVVTFTSVPAPGHYYHPKIDLIDSAGGQYKIHVMTSCTAADTCGAIDTFQMNYPENPNTCQSFSDCTDQTPKRATWTVRVTRTAYPTTCAPYTVRATNQ